MCSFQRSDFITNFARVPGPRDAQIIMTSRDKIQKNMTSREQYHERKNAAIIGVECERCRPEILKAFARIQAENPGTAHCKLVKWKYKTAHEVTLTCDDCSARAQEPLDRDSEQLRQIKAKMTRLMKTGSE